eukprot:95186-Amorphochlora_amoeboformis.AAC.1
MERSARRKNGIVLKERETSPKPSCSSGSAPFYWIKDGSRSLRAKIREYETSSFAFASCS